MTTQQEIKWMREWAGMSQQAFANELGVSIRAVANWEAGRAPAPSMKAKLFKFGKDHGMTMATIKPCECCGRAL